MPTKIKIALTGGGTAGHVMPHFAMLPLYRQMGWDVFYIGSKGLEKNMVKEQGVPFYEIATGKLRRYLSFENFLDLFKVGWGTVQAFFLLLGHKPKLVFSKGGFVSVPVAIAAWLLRIPVITHESDLTPGLATRIIMRFAEKILYSFPETKKYLPATKACLTGLPVRPELFTGAKERGLALCGFDQDCPVLLVTGGSLGAARINETLLAALPKLVRDFQIIHLTGKGKTIPYSHKRYKGIEFATHELKDLFAAADLVLGRSGANSIFEFLALKKPMLLIPLTIGSRGDQIHNAEAFAQEGWAQILREENLTAESLCQSLKKLATDSAKMRDKLAAATARPSESLILEELKPFLV